MASKTVAPAANTRTVTFEGLRGIASDNPEVAVVIKGFVNGKAKSLAIPKATRSLYIVDATAGTVTMPVGKRGRRATPGLSQADLDALLG